MKQVLDKEDFKPQLMTQPVGNHTPDAGVMGPVSPQETPFCDSCATLDHLASIARLTYCIL